MGSRKEKRRIIIRASPVCLSGASDLTGFFIKDLDGVVVKSADYIDIHDPKDKDKYPAFLPPPNEIKFFKGNDLLVLSRKIGQERAEWHTVEHKVVNLLESGKKVTLRNLKKTSPVSEFCGGQNSSLREPPNEKLKEGLRVALKYLELKTLPSFFEPPLNGVWKKELVL